MNRIVAGGLVATGLFFYGCMTTHTEYQPDGKTPRSITKVGMGHDVDLPSGAKIKTSDGVTSAGIALGSEAIKTLGATFASQVVDKASQTITESSRGTTEGAN